jgi:hypothetical protein
MKKFLKVILPFAFTVVFTASAALSPATLRCEYAVNPLNVDITSPRLFWVDESPERGQHQTAYQILAASSEKNLAADKGDLWDSGKVVSDETIQIPYGGKALTSLQPVFWKVRAWDASGKPSAWSKPARWTMGCFIPPIGKLNGSAQQTRTCLRFCCAANLW